MQLGKISTEKKALFLIPCCSTKSVGGNHPAWNKVCFNKLYNKFYFLDKYRIQIIDFYRSLSHEKAFIFYKNRGDKKSVIRKKIDAWEKNLRILESDTMPAIERYQGRLYENIDNNLLDQLINNEIDNVIIVSALMGIIAPTDLIPDYNLIMKDKCSDYKAVWKFWSESFSNTDAKPHLLQQFFNFDYNYCLMSEESKYINSVIGVLPHHNSYRFISMGRGQATILQNWGGILNDALLEAAVLPEELEKIAERNNCMMKNLSDSKNSNYYNYKNQKIHRNESLTQTQKPKEFGGKKMSQADEIRDFVQRDYIEPARREGKSQITIRAGDVDRKMRLGRVPNVNQVLGGMIIERLCGIRLLSKEGTHQSTTMTYTYEILPKT